VEVGWGNVILNETTEAPVVPFPDVVGVIGGGFIGARETTAEDDVETMYEGQSVKLSTPFDPVGFSEVKDKIGGPIAGL
jgi:hypothetical protein